MISTSTPRLTSSRLRFVTRASVKQYWIAHHEAKRRIYASRSPPCPSPKSPRFTGETPERSWTSSGPVSLRR